MKHMHTIAATLLAFGSASTLAQSAGQWSVKAGVNHIRPQVSSGDLSASSLPGTKIDVKGATALIVTGTYMLTDAISLEGYVGAPYEHDIVGDGAIAGVGKIGSTKQVSPTLFAQYRFGAPTGVRPYVGLGVTYAHFYGEKGTNVLTALTNPGGPATRLSVDAAWGVSPQLGITVPVDGARWLIDLSVIKTFIKTTSTLSTGQSIRTKLDPVAANVSVGYRF